MKRLSSALLLVLFAALLGALPAAAQPALRVDAARIAAPISPYIYGQFIEHLGRSIYGGLWAEMLEDRKFFYPVTDVYAPWGTASDPNWKAGEFRHLVASPWKVVGPAGSVVMDTAGAYAGRHTPVVRLAGAPAGLGQEGLAVVAGRTYNGRVVLAGPPSAAPVEVRLVLDDGTVLLRRIRALTPHAQAFPFSFQPETSADNARLEIVGLGRGDLRVGPVSLMPADNLAGWRADVVALLRELDAPIYRWPGGNFVSGYDWRDGIGERDRRPPRKNPAWTGIEPNDVGLHEFMHLMTLLGSEAYVAVNTGLGTVDAVAEEVAYANAPTGTPMGDLRARNGHPEPFGVRWWAVGNEMYGEWQLGHMPLSDYVAKHRRVAEAMWKVDPKAQLVGVGSTGEWSETMLRDAGAHMNLISEHIYAQDLPETPAHVAQLARMIREKADAHRRYRATIPGLAERDIRIAMDEWNYWYGDYRYGELGVRYVLRDALGIAAGLHEFFRNSDLYFMANYAQTVNVIGAIKTTRTAAAFDATALPLVLYRRHFGTLPVAVAGAPEGFDVAAAWTADRKALTVALVNPTAEARRFPLDLQGAALPARATRWTLADADPLAYNEPGRPPRLVVREDTADLSAGALDVPAYGIALYRLETTPE